MARVLGRTVAGIASMLALALLVCAAPAWLAGQSAFIGRAGGLLRAGGPQRAWQALLRPPDAATWHAVLVGASWAVWAWLVTCVVLEAVATVGRASPTSPSAAAAVPSHGVGRGLAALILGPLLLVVAARHDAAPRPRQRPAAVAARRSFGGVDVDDRSRAAALAHPAAGSAPSQRPAPSAAPPGKGGSPLLMFLVGAGGALVALVVEEVRRAGDARELRQLRRALVDAAPPPAAGVPSVDGTTAESVAEEREHPRDDVRSTHHVHTTRARPQDVPPRPAQRAGGVLVSLLGEPLIEGAEGPFDRPKVVESLVYLALHPDGVTKQRWATALWPDRALSPNSLNTAVWQLRRALGVDERGERHLPAARSGRLRLGPDVATDLALLEELVAEGSSEALAAALALVRGRPFEGLGDPDWVVLEGHAARADRLVVDAALRLGSGRLAARDWAGASWAGRQAIAASPYDERLYALLAEAARGAGDRGAELAALEEQRRALGTTTPSASSRAG